MPTNCGYRCVDGFDVGADEPYWNTINTADPFCPEHGYGPLYSVLYSRICQEIHVAKSPDMCHDDADPKPCGKEAADDIMNLVEKLLEER